MDGGKKAHRNPTIAAGLAGEDFDGSIVFSRWSGLKTYLCGWRSTAKQSS
jgi:hypothetical protein